MRASVLVRLERLRLAVGAIEGEHQLGAQALPVRVVCNQDLELLDHVGVLAERELRLDQLLERRAPQVVQACHLGLGEWLIGEIRQRRPSPQRQRFLELRTAESARLPASSARPPATSRSKRCASSCSGSSVSS